MIQILKRSSNTLNSLKFIPTKEEKFTSPEELIAQMNKDRESGIRIFNEINNSKRAAQ